jgi:ankyrin repeat protein
MLLNASSIRDRSQPLTVGRRFLLGVAVLIVGGWAIGQAFIGTGVSHHDEALARLQIAMLEGDDAAFDAARSEPSSVLTPADLEDALRLAAVYGNESCFTRLLAGGVNPNAADDRGNTTLMLLAIRSVRSDTLPMAHQLLDAGADVNAIDDWGRTALMKAVATKRTEIVRFLLEHGARVQGNDLDGESALSEAFRTGDAEIIELIDQAVEKSRHRAKSDAGRRIG